MSLFTKKHKKADAKLPKFQDAGLKTAFERIIFEELETTENAYIVGLAKELLNGNPLVINFENVDVDEANKVVAFLSGVIYAIKGRVEQIQTKIFVFARDQDFKDGSLKAFIKEYKKV